VVASGGTADERGEEKPPTARRRAARERGPKLRAELRERDTVKPLELFFDLVFVLAITQCTALMAHDTTWGGLGKGLLVLGVLWWAWVGYAWLTSVVDPEDTLVRVVIIASMAALLVVALCVPQAFGDTALLFACAYTAFRILHIALFILSSRNSPALRSSVWGLAASTAIAAVLLVAASFAGALQEPLLLLALVLDAGGPYLFGAEGWQLVPGHFAERHGLIVLIALGESIVAIGAGSAHVVDAGVVVAAVIGTLVVAGLWWLYFDVVALVAARRLSNAAEGRERNTIARDSFSYLHFPMVAGIVLVALGLKKTLGHVSVHLAVVPATALLGGTALYLLAHIAFRWRNVHRFSSQRLIVAIVCVALIPVGTRIPALATIALLALVLLVLIVYERVRFRELRQRLLHQVAAEGAGPSVPAR
jgi:low temperature requirement protein LtrA